MRIDLHCHTKRVKTGDGPGRNVTPELFAQKIIDADVKIAAITNHNTFDMDQFESFKKAVFDNCQLWPGVEIDIKQHDKERWHLIVVANPDNVEMFSEAVEKLFKCKNLQTCTCTIKEVYDALNKCDVIYIAHFHKKPSISEEDHDELVRIVGDNYRVFDETPDNRSLGVFANYGYNVMIGSDVKDWNNYENSTFADLRLPVSNFQQFCLLAKRDVNIINTLLNKRQSFSLVASPYKSIKIPLTIYQDVNIIFGQKGTGKSEILNSLYDQMVSQGFSCRKYAGSEKDSDFNELTKTKDMKRDLKFLGIDDCAKEFENIFNWTDTNPTLFKNYLDWYSTRDNNKNKSRMKITESSELVETGPNNYEAYFEDRKIIKNITKEFSKINFFDYLENGDIDLFNELLNKMIIKNLELLKNDIISLNAVKLTNYSIEKIKSIADKNSDTVSKPASTGFREFACKRLELLKMAKKIRDSFEAAEYNDRTYLGTIEDKGKIYINKKYRMLCESAKRQDFSIGITKLRKISELLFDINTNFFISEIATTINEFSDLCKEEKISSLKEFLGLSKQIITESGEEYSPSNGERGILLLQQILSEGADGYFLDEPELGMGNSYIDTNIRPIISSLAKQHKTVVIATHNANIAVRTLPYMSIFRTHKNGVYCTYVGNPFDDQLKNIDDETDIKSWTMESLHTLEGGKEAFYERKNIYETSGD